MIQEAIVKIVDKQDLTYDEAYTVMNEIMSGETTPTQNAAFLAALSTKSARAETTDEIAGCAAAMRDHAIPVKTDMDMLNEVGMCFFFAQKYHTSMKYVGPIRKELGIRTVFNILGPLTNPGSPTMQLLGVYDEYLVEPLAQVLINLGVKRGMVVYGQDKLDEISLSAPTTICAMRDGWFKTEVITPEDFGFQRCTKEDLRGGTPAENAQITLNILKGAQGHKRNAVLLNAGAALYIGGKAETMKDGVARAAELIDSGKALHTLKQLIEVSNRPEAEV